MSSIPNKLTVSSKKNNFEKVREVDFGKSSEDLCSDINSQTPGAAGETPFKKLVKKSAKPEDEKTEKKISTAVTDKLPKKNAQRTKGSIAIHKTIAEKANAESPEKQINDVAQTKVEGHVENVKSGADDQKSPTVARCRESKMKAVAKKVGKRDTKLIKEQKPSTEAEEKQSIEALKVDETNLKEEPVETQTTDTRLLNPPIATCSFFEKLQQGVKSYFGSKNSLTSYDKIKKEGGNQNCARVAKGVKEDSEKKEPGLIVKNDICSSESESYHDEVRLNSNLGGKSNNFSSNKPKIFRMLIRKKLYHPKKHYVRIQIPRKGYFYRSSVQLKTPRSTSSGQFERMEPQAVPKSESKVQISGLASTSPKGSHLPNKKVVKQRQSNSKYGFKLKNDRLSPEYLDQLASYDKSGYSFYQVVSNYLLLHWPDENSLFQNQKKLQLENNLALKLLNPELEQGSDAGKSAILENFDSRKTENLTKKKSFRPRADSFQSFVKTEGKVHSSTIKQKKTSETTFEALMNCISSTLGNDNLIGDLEITPVSTKKAEDKEFAYKPTKLQSFSNEPLDFTEIMKAFNNFEYDCENSVKSDTLYISPVPLKTFSQFEHELSTVLMEEIDLHSEFQNYLKEYDRINKNKAKNEQENDISGDVVPANQINQLSNFGECKSYSSFTSISSIHSQEEEIPDQLRGFVDRKRDMISFSEECIGTRQTKVSNSQNEYGDESEEIRKIRSENDPKKLPREAKLKSSIKRTLGKTSFHVIHKNDKEIFVPGDLSSLSKNFSVKDSIGSYEKIMPFPTNSNKNCSDAKAKNERKSILLENIVNSQSADSVSQRLQKVLPDGQNPDLEALHPCVIVDPYPFALPEKSSNSETISPSGANPEPNSKKWSPTLQDLIEIYNSVLKQNKSIRQKSHKNMLKDSFSSHLIAFLNEKLKENQFKQDLIKLSKDFSTSCKPPNNWKPIKLKSNSLNVKEYVAMFQEILRSSLTISQISRLNDIISDLQNYSEKNYNVFKDLKKTADAVTETEKKTETDDLTSENIKSVKKKVKKQHKSSSLSSKSKMQLPVQTSGKTGKLSKTSRVLSRTNFKSKTSKSSSKEIACDHELEFLLKTCFDSVDVFFSDTEMTSANNKVLVTVKLSGNRIVVNNLSYINSEDAISSQESNPEGTSELIIESVTRDQLKHAWYETKCSKLKNIKQSQTKEMPQKVNSKSIRVKVPKTKKGQRETKAKEILSDSKVEDVSGQENLFLQQYKPSKIISSFDYDHMQLRTQHPINAIVESSESKVSEIAEAFENKSKPSTAKKTPSKNASKNSVAAKLTMKEALAKNVSSKDLFRNFDWSADTVRSGLGRAKSFVIRRQIPKGSFTKKKEFAKTARSVVDLNRKSCFKKKSRKTPVRVRERCLCFQSAYSFQDKPLKFSRKPKEKFKDIKKIVNPVSSLKTTSKNKSVDFESKRQKSELDLTAALNLEESSSKRSLHFYDKAVTECSSVEVLLSKKVKEPSTFSVSERQSSIALTQRNLGSVQKGIPNTNETSEAANSASEPPVTLLSARSNSKEFSFPASIMHSDSSLKRFSPQLKENLGPLFKSNSDMKFYPERINENETNDNSFITFELTPKKKETAGFFNKKVQVVIETRTAKTAAGANAVAAPLASALDNSGGVSNEHTKGNVAEDDLFKVDETNSLRSIERFIDQYSKLHKRAMKQKQTEAKKKNEEIKLMQTPPLFNGRRKTNPQTLPFAKFTSEKKVYHECQKKRKELARIGMDVKKGMRASDKTEITQIKKVKIVEKKDKTEKSHMFFPNKFKDFIKVLEDFKENLSDEEREKKTNSRKDSKIFVGETMGTEIKTADVKDEEKMSMNINFLSEVIEAIKTALGQVEDLKSKSEIILLIEKELNKKRLKPCDGDAVAEKFVKPVVSKKLKTVKIKIRCPELKNSESQEQGQSAKNIFVEKVELPNEENLTPQEPVGEVELLNSIVAKEAEGVELERKRSLYFDAVEKAMPDEIEGTREKIDHSQRAFEKPGISDFNANFGMEQNNHRPLIPLEENLLSRNSFTNESEEEILNQISKSLKEDKISHSMALLDHFLKKIENSSGQEESCFKLRRPLRLIENKSRNLMMEMGRSSRLKVISLLEEVAHIFETEDIEGSMRCHLEITKAFIDRIEALNMSRLTDLNTLFQQPFIKSDKSNIRKVFNLFLESLNFLKEKFTLKHASS